MTEKGLPSQNYEANQLTKALRPNHGLSEEQVKEIRKRRRNHEDFDSIAKSMGLGPEQVKIASAPLRTPLKVRKRNTLNIDNKTYDLVVSCMNPGETIGQAAKRLILSK